MPNYLYVADPTPYDGLRYTFNITGYLNVDGIICGDGVDVNLGGA